MEVFKLTKEDLDYIANKGIDFESFKRYMAILEKGNRPPELIRPCTLDDGIERLDYKEQETYIEIYEKEASKGRCSKFVPASGAATRMFQCLCPVFKKYSITTLQDLVLMAQSMPELREALRFFQSIDQFPFFPELQTWCSSQGCSVEEMLERGDLKRLVQSILSHDDGLGLGTLPKALLPFHRYGEDVRTAFDEHVLEAAYYITDVNSICRIHFTVPEEHLARFRERAKAISKKLAAKGLQIYISFSIQHPSTHTPASDEQGKLIRTSDGKILLRPGGHGSLLKNLQEFDGDIVFIKNVDNVAEDHIKPMVVRWKKILGGVLVTMEQDFNLALEELEKEPSDIAKAESVLIKWKQPFPPNYDSLSDVEKKHLLKVLLDRPKRVCGMVPKLNQPGGGPFWIKDQNGWIWRQIVEKAQINFNDHQQLAVWNSSTHFNPVDVVCALRNYQGKPYDLGQFVDSNSYIITTKSYNGVLTKVLEHPGLWNGSMAFWITIFIEVPRETFHPVKQITDLLAKGTK